MWARGLQPRPQCLTVSQAQTWLSPRTFSAGATEDAQWLRNRAQCRTGLDSGRWSAEGTVSGVVWGIGSSAWCYQPQRLQIF